MIIKIKGLTFECWGGEWEINGGKRDGKGTGKKGQRSIKAK